jgi:hypothetical protein
MKKKTLRSQIFNPSVFLELSDREAESLQGGVTKASDDLISPAVVSLVLLFANPFSG